MSRLFPSGDVGPRFKHGDPLPISTTELPQVSDESPTATATMRVPLTAEQIDVLEREFDAALLMLEWRKSRRAARDVAHKAFRDLVVTCRAGLEDRERLRGEIKKVAQAVYDLNNEQWPTAGDYVRTLMINLAGGVPTRSGQRRNDGGEKR